MNSWLKGDGDFHTSFSESLITHVSNGQPTGLLDLGHMHPSE